MIWLFNSMMSRFVQRGRIRVVVPDGRVFAYGDGTDPDLSDVTVKITDSKLLWSLIFNPELHAGEAYMDQTLVFEQGTIRDLLTIFAYNRKNLRGSPMQLWLRRMYKSIRTFHQRNTISQSRANVAHHYDLSNDLYRLFLDDDLNYSCALFSSAGESLEVAQRNKLRHIAAKLALRPGQRVLDIGSGWGSMALYLAEFADVEVVGVTLSTDQHELATARAKERGLDDRVRFELLDYRKITGTFDRIVSIGMFEHVGVNNFPSFFAKLSALLDDDGVALVHSIGRMKGPSATPPWIRKYIFPGGYVPALSEVFSVVEKSGLKVTDVEILRLQYAETLLAWEARFRDHRTEIAGLLDERFCRMWEFYLIAAEMGFRYGGQMVFQMQFTKSMDALPITRDYMADATAALRAREAGGVLADER